MRRSAVLALVLAPVCAGAGPPAGTGGKLGTEKTRIVLTYRILVSFGYRWTKPLRHGPAAWLWRSMTCVNRQPMKQPG